MCNSYTYCFYIFGQSLNWCNVIYYDNHVIWVGESLSSYCSGSTWIYLMTPAIYTVLDSDSGVIQAVRIYSNISPITLAGLSIGWKET